jgi:O-antigen/teichoic acid export membrane protein
MVKNLASRTNSSLFFRLFFSGCGQITALAFGILLARLLTPKEFGVIAIVNMIVFYANNFSNFGLNNALVQKADINEKHVNTVFTIDLLISVLLAILTISSSTVIANFFGAPEIADVLKVMSLYYLTSTFYYIPLVKLKRAIDFKVISIIDFCKGLATSVCAIGLALNGLSYWSIVIPTIVFQVVAAIALKIKTGWEPRIVIAQDMRDIYSFGFFVFIRNQVELVVAKVDYFVIGRYLDLQSLGLYEKSYELATRTMAGASGPFNSVIYSTFCRVNSDLDKVKSVFMQGSTLLAAICYPALLGIIAIAPHFVLTCLGEIWADSILPLQILSLASAIRVFQGMVASVNVAIGKHKFQTYLTMISALLFIGLCFALVKYGIVLISIAYLIYCSFSLLSSLIVLSINIKITLFDLVGALWCPIIGSILMMLTVFFFRNYYFHNYYSFFELGVLILIGGVVYVVWFSIFLKLKMVNYRISIDDR